MTQPCQPLEALFAGLGFTEEAHSGADRGLNLGVLARTAHRYAWVGFMLLWAGLGGRSG